MQAKLPKVFSECLARLRRGEAVNSCLAEYPYLRQQLVPLLYTALSISTIPKAAPSDDFRKLSKGRLIARLQARSLKAEKSRQPEAAPSGLGTLWRGLERAITGPAKVAIPLTLVLVLALQCFLFFGTLNFISPSQAPALVSRCTLSTLTGSVQLQIPGSSTWVEAENGATLEAGSRVKTDTNSQALLTFFNGTTVTLEPGTDLIVEKVEFSGENQPNAIILKQRLGKTWSRVTKLVDPGSRYEIETPSGVALVRGTLFTTEVDETGAMRVQTKEGLVSVSAQGGEVFLPPGWQTIVESGASPSAPVPVSQGESDKPWGQSKGTTPVPGNNAEKPIDKIQEKPSEKAVATEPSAESAKPSPEQSTEVTPAQGRDSKGPSAQSQDRLPVQGQANGQGQATGTTQGQDSEQHGIDNMWWVILGIAVFSLGATAYMWRRQ